MFDATQSRTCNIWKFTSCCCGSCFHFNTETVYSLHSQFLQHYSLLCWLIFSKQIHHGATSPESPAAVANSGFSVLKSRRAERIISSSWTAIPPALFITVKSMHLIHAAGYHAPKQSIIDYKFTILRKSNLNTHPFHSFISDRLNHEPRATVVILSWPSSGQWHQNRWFV